VDDVCVSLNAAGCDGNSGVLQREPAIAWSAVSPFSERLDVLFGGPTQQSVQLALFDPEGRLVSTRMVASGQHQVEWDTADLCNGLYVLSAFNQGKAMAPVRVLRVSP